MIDHDADVLKCFNCDSEFVNDAGARLITERDRYRAALEHIVKRAATDCCANGRGCCICDCDDIAKEALKGEP